MQLEQQNSDTPLGEQTRLAISTHSYSGKYLKDYPSLLEYLLQVKHACAWSNSQLGMISIIDYEKIAAACEKLKNCYDLFCADVLIGGGGIAVHMNICEAICIQLGDQSWRLKVNTSQSTTDVCSTALSLTLSKKIHQCKEICFSLITVLKQLAHEYMPMQSVGRTCLRDAGFINYGERFFGFSELFKRHYDSLDNFSNFAYSNLGGTALGTGEGIEPALRTVYSQFALEKLIELTGINIRPHAHFIDSVQNRDDLFHLASMIEAFTVSLLKMAKDIRLLGSGPKHGFNEIQLPALIQGSSFYPQKTNPTLEETIIQMSFLVLGLVKSAKLGIEHSELDMNIYYLHSSICLLDALRMINDLLPKYIQYNLAGLKVKPSAIPAGE